MAKLKLNSLNRQINKIFLTQSVLVLLLAMVFALIRGERAALAVVCGGSVYIIPSYFYAVRLFSNISSHAITRIMLVFYLGEILKLIVSVGLFIALLKFLSFPLLPYFLGYLLATLAFCVTPVGSINRTRVST